MAVELTRTKVRAGVWEGMLTGTAKPPLLSVTHLSTQVAGAEITPVPGAPGQYRVRVPIPVELLADGVQTFVISDAATDERLVVALEVVRHVGRELVEQSRLAAGPLQEGARGGLGGQCGVEGGVESGHATS